jgi:hypothetical protein
MLSASRVMAMRHHPVACLASVHLTPAADWRAWLADAPDARQTRERPDHDGHVVR